MLQQYTNNLNASIFLWAQHIIEQRGLAYNTLTMRLFPTKDQSIPTSYQSYSAPLKGFVYDSGISGAYIIQNVSGGGFSAPLTRASGIHIDYINGRVLVPKSLGTDMVLTGTASVPDFRFYQANETEEQILTQGKYFVNPRFMSALSVSGAPPGAYATPAIFMNSLSTRNDAFALGGLVDTKNTYTFTVLTESNYMLDAALSIFRDTRFQYIPNINTFQDPLDQWGDFKGGTGYNYREIIQLWGQPGNLIYIEDVRTSKVSDKIRINPQQFAGIVDIDVCFVRQSPINSTVFT